MTQGYMEAIEKTLQVSHSNKQKAL